MDLKAEARRLAEETWRKGPMLGSIESIESALLAFGRLVREEDAKVCDDEWRNSTNESPEFRQNKISHGCIASAAAIRAKALE